MGKGKTPYIGNHSQTAIFDFTCLQDYANNAQHSFIDGTELVALPKDNHTATYVNLMQYKQHMLSINYLTASKRIEQRGASMLFNAELARIQKSPAKQRAVASISEVAPTPPAPSLIKKLFSLFIKKGC